VHKSQAGTAALRLTVLSLQAKSVSAFLGELASGKLTSPGSVLHETLRWYQLGIHTLQGQVQTLQSAPSAQRLNELQRLLEQAQHESADLRKRLSAAEAQVRMQSYRISAAQNALAVYRSSNKKNILQTVRLGDRLCQSPARDLWWYQHGIHTLQEQCTICRKVHLRKVHPLFLPRPTARQPICAGDSLWLRPQSCGRRRVGFQRPKMLLSRALSIMTRSAPKEQAHQTRMMPLYSCIEYK